MILIEAKNQRGESIVNTFPDTEIPNSARCVQRATQFGEVKICIDGESRIVNSNKVFNSYTSALIEALELTFNVIEKNARIIADDYLHNITKIHGNQKSIIERLTMFAEEGDTYSDFRNRVKDTVKESLDDTAEDICALAKEVRLIDYHIGGYKLLTNISEPLVTHNHNLKKFLLGLTHLFFESFNTNNILVSLHDVQSDFRCSFEYETFNIALHSFVENITKYAKPYSKVTAYTDFSSMTLTFEMESIRIDKDEKIKIFERGFSGRCVPKDMRGSGIGMYLMKKSLERSNIEISVVTDYGQSTELNGVRYDKNKFIFYFPM